MIFAASAVPVKRAHKKTRGRSTERPRMLGEARRAYPLGRTPRRYLTNTSRASVTTAAMPHVQSKSRPTLGRPVPLWVGGRVVAVAIGAVVAVLVDTATLCTGTGVTFRITVTTAGTVLVAVPIVLVAVGVSGVGLGVVCPLVGETRGSLVKIGPGVEVGVCVSWFG